METRSAIGLSGAFAFKVIPAKRAPLTWRVKNFLVHRLPGLPALLVYRLLGSLFGLVYIESALRLRVRKVDGTWIDYGLVGTRVVTTAGVNKIVALLNASDAVTGAAFKYHGLGKQVAPTAAAVGDTALQSELSTEYNPDSTRATGTQTTGSASNIYESVGTNTFDASVNLTEAGIFSSATAGAGTLLDRFTFTTVPLSSGESLQGTFDLTVSAGG
jgi:hypothetical protein